MSHSINMSEKEALLQRGSKSKYGPVTALASTDELSATVSTGVFKSRSLLQMPGDNAYTHGIPIWRAAFLVVNSALGAGILNFPQAYAQCGDIATAVITQMSLLVFITGAFLILAYCADKHGSQNFQEVMRDALGPTAYIVTEIIVLVYMFGSSVAYMIIIGDQLESVAHSVNPDCVTPECMHWYQRRDFLMCVVCIFLLLPICLPKSLKILSYTSAFGSIGAAYVGIVAAVKYFELGPQVSPDKINPGNLPWTYTLAAVPYLCFGFQCHVPAVAVYAELKRASVPRFAVVVIAAMLICSTAYTVTAVFGVLTFGSTVDSDVLKSYGASDVMVSVARIVLAVIVLSTYAMVLFCGRSSVEGLYLTARRMPPGQAEMYSRFRRVFQTILWFSFSLIVAIKVPSISYAIAIIGGIAALFIFFFPGLCLVQEMLRFDVLDRLKMFMIVLGAFYVVIGVFIFTDSEVLAIMQDISGKSLY